MYWYRLFAMLTLLIVLAAVTPAYAEAQNCQTRTWVSDSGKTPNLTHGVATDGCHTYDFTTTAAAAPASGTVTFKTSAASMGLEADKPLVQAGSHCEFMVVAQANLAFVNYFGVPDGTEVRVKYACE